MFRRRTLPAALPEDGDAARWGALGVTGPLVGEGGANVGGQTGWKPFGHGQHASDQIGAYAAPPLNFYPAYIDEVQRKNGVEGFRSHWYTPTQTYVANGDLQQTQAGANVPGRQRSGSIFGGFIGPISARKMRSRVTAAAVQQTALMGQAPWVDLVQSWNPAPTAQTGE